MGEFRRPRRPPSGTSQRLDSFYNELRRCAYGSFNRSFSLPENLDEEKLTAKLTDGVLAVEIPRLQKAKPRRIEINGSRPSESDEKK
jgi:HSP20 family molecular chaperone IbpA